MERITVEDVRAAVAKTGGRLVRHVTWKPEDRCGCPLGLVAVSEGVHSADVWPAFPVEIAAGLGLDREYARGIICGFDDSELADDADPTMLAGYRDGQAIALALLLTTAEVPTP